MGTAVARRLGSGKHIVLADNDPERLGDAAESLSGDGHIVHRFSTDVSDGESVRALADAAAILGPVRCIAHTAGVSPVQASAQRIMMVDVLGTAHVLDAFVEKACPGTVCVCIASMAGSMITLDREVEHQLALTPTDELPALPILDMATTDPGSAYAIAKRANQLRVRGASREWGLRGARVVSISPGVISTPMGREELVGSSGAFMDRMIEGSGAGRVGTPDDIAAVAEFLASPAAAFLTGTDVLVDGGAVAGLLYGPKSDPATV
jgi:NAD(P)-dependent dehydrogenase (short-subunit alcohol dehydrogenase family)